MAHYLPNLPIHLPIHFTLKLSRDLTWIQLMFYAVYCNKMSLCMMCWKSDSFTHRDCCTVKSPSKISWFLVKNLNFFVTVKTNYPELKVVWGHGGNTVKLHTLSKMESAAEANDVILLSSPSTATASNMLQVKLILKGLRSQILSVIGCS